MSTRIIIADDHKLVRSGLRALIEERADFEVIAECQSGRETVDRCRELLPDILITDLQMPGEQRLQHDVDRRFV